MKRIYLVRHGETDANLHQRVPGPEEPLNARGLAQAAALAERTKHLNFEKIMTSNFARAQQTAQAIAAVKDLPIEAHPAFREIMEPSSLRGAREDDERVVLYRKTRNAHMEDPTWRQEDGENCHDAIERIRSARALLESDPAGSILVASHAFFLQAFAAALLLDATAPSNTWMFAAKTLKVSNAGISLLTITDKKWHIATWNDHAHFAE